MDIEAVGKSDVGRVRAQNEDSFLVAPPLGLYVVADGMGGHVGGQTASRLTVETLAAEVTRAGADVDRLAAGEVIEDTGVARLLADALRRACAAVYAAALANPELRGMGTTCTAMIARSGRAFVAHVGDSRCYLRRGEAIMQLTDDHSLVNEQLKAGLIDEEQARSSRMKNIITRSVGFERDVAVDTLSLPVVAGDSFLLCSDGLANVVDDAEMGAALAAPDLAAVPQTLIDLANARGGDDNITVICLRAGSAP